MVRRALRDRRGVTALEFALTMPIFLTVILLAMEAAWQLAIGAGLDQASGASSSSRNWWMRSCVSHASTSAFARSTGALPRRAFFGSGAAAATGSGAGCASSSSSSGSSRAAGFVALAFALTFAGALPWPCFTFASFDFDTDFFVAKLASRARDLPQRAG